MSPWTVGLRLGCTRQRVPAWPPALHLPPSKCTRHPPTEPRMISSPWLMSRLACLASRLRARRLLGRVAPPLSATRPTSVSARLRLLHSQSMTPPPPFRPREPRSLLMSPLTRRGRVWPGPPRRRPALGFRLGGGCSGPDRLLALRSQWVTSLRARRPALPTEPASSTAGHGTTPPGLRDLAWAAPASGACAGRCGPALLSLQSRLLSLGWASRGSGGSTARCRAGLRLAHAATASCLDAMLALTRAPSSPPKRSVWRGWPRALTLGARSSAGGIRGGSRRRRATRVARTSTSLMTAVARVCFRTSSSATRGTSSSKTTWAASTRV